MNQFVYTHRIGSKIDDDLGVYLGKGRTFLIDFRAVFFSHLNPIDFKPSQTDSIDSIDLKYIQKPSNRLC